MTVEGLRTVSDPHVCFVELSYGDETTLAPDELQRAARYRRRRDRQRFVARRAALRATLGRGLGRHPAALRFRYGPAGKPRLEDAPALHFNCAHSDGLALIATAETEIGVDLERVVDVPELEAIAARFFSPAERAAIDDIEAFYRCWVRKEAYLKARGTGLSASTRAFSVDVAADATTRIGAWTVAPVCAPSGFVAALCARGAR